MSTSGGSAEKELEKISAYNERESLVLQSGGLTRFEKLIRLHYFRILSVQALSGYCMLASRFQSPA